MKEIAYRSKNGIYLGQLKYYRLAHSVYFRAIGRRTSINDADQIVATIAENEGVHWDELEYFDVQFPEQYPGRVELEVDSLEVTHGDNGPSVNSWLAISITEVPREVRREFVI